MSDPRHKRRSQPTEDTQRKIELAKQERQAIEAMPDGKKKIAVRKAWYIKWGEILGDFDRWERYLSGVYDRQAQPDPYRDERLSRPHYDR